MICTSVVGIYHQKVLGEAVGVDGGIRNFWFETAIGDLWVVRTQKFFTAEMYV